MPSFKPVAAIGRGLNVLRVVNRERLATVGSIHQTTGLDKATIVRVLETLEHEGYVMRDPDRTTYAPTGRCLLLSEGYDQHLWIGQTAEPLLRELRQSVDWPCEMALFDHDAMVIADTLREQGSMFYLRKPGFRVPLLVSSLGLAYLAFCGADERERILAKLKMRSGKWNDRAADKKAIDRVLRLTHQRGYALSDGDYLRDVFQGKLWAVGVPVHDGERVFGSLNVMMLRNAVTEADGVALCVEPLQRTAAGIAAILAGRRSLPERAERVDLRVSPQACASDLWRRRSTPAAGRVGSA